MWIKTDEFRHYYRHYLGKCWRVIETPGLLDNGRRYLVVMVRPDEGRGKVSALVSLSTLPA